MILEHGENYRLNPEYHSGMNGKVSLAIDYFVDSISEIRNSGNVGFSINKSLLEKYPFLANYRENLEYYFSKTGFSEKDILGEGNYGLVIKIPNGRIIKIAKNKEVSDKLKEEALNQEKFYIALNRIRGKYGVDIVPDWIRIPFIMECPKENPEGYYAFEMELVDGKTLRNYDAKVFYRDRLLGIDEKILEGLSDIDIDELLISSGVSYEEIVFNSSYGGEKIFSEYFPDRGLVFSNVLRLLAEEGYEHNDLHVKNIMLSGERVYMIDFGIVKLPL